MFKDVGAGGGGNDLEPTLLDPEAQVAKLTSAFNFSTQAQGRMGEEFRALRVEAARVASNLSENETACDKIENLHIRREDRSAY